MLYVFGDAILDTQRHELRCAGIPVRLEPKAYQMLTYLVRHHDRVVSKQELLAELWSGTNVHESAVARYISAVRHAIGDRQDVQHVIQTIYGKGYRCVALVLTYSSATSEEEGELAFSGGTVNHARTISPPPTSSRTHPAVSPNMPGGTETVRWQCCRTCRYGNAPTARFCTVCGAPLP